MYSDILDNPKVQQLPPALFKHWVNLLALANRQEPRGGLPPMDEIAFALRVSPAAAQKAVDELAARRLVDCDGNGTYGMHNWTERQKSSDDVTARVRQWRVSRNVDGNGGETLPQHARVRVERESKDTEESESSGSTPSAILPGAVADAWNCAAGMPLASKADLDTFSEWLEQVPGAFVLEWVARKIAEIQRRRNGKVLRASVYTGDLLQDYRVEREEAANPRMGTTALDYIPREEWDLDTRPKGDV